MSAPRLPQIMFIYPTCPGSPENIGGDLAQAAANLRYLQHGSRSPKSDLAKAFTDKDVYRHLVLEKAALDLRDRISPDWKKCPVSEFAGIWFSTSAGNGLYQQWLEKKIPTKAFVGGLMRNNMVSAWYPGELRGKTIEVVDHEGGFILLHRVLWKACGMEMKKPTPPTVSSPEKVTELVESPTPRSADRERESDRMLLQAKRQEEAEQEAVLRHHHWAQAKREEEEEKRRVQDRMFSSQAPPFSAMCLDGEMAQTLRGRPGLEFPDALTEGEPWEWAAAPPVRESYLSRDSLHTKAPFPESAEALRQNRSAFLDRHEAFGATKQLTVKQLREITRREAQTANSQPDSRDFGLREQEVVAGYNSDILQKIDRCSKLHAIKLHEIFRSWRGMLFQRKQEEAVRLGKERMEMEFLTRLYASFRNWKKITVAATIERERLVREEKLEQMEEELLVTGNVQLVRIKFRAWRKIILDRRVQARVRDRQRRGQLAALNLFHQAFDGWVKLCERSDEEEDCLDPTLSL